MNKKRLLTVMGNTLSYQQRIKTLFGASLLAYYPMNESSGSVAYDYSGNGRNGTYANVTLGQLGIGDGKTSVAFNGTNSYLDIFSTSLRDAFNTDEGTAFLWIKPSAATFWTTSAITIMMLMADGNNRVMLRSSDFAHTAGGIYKANAPLAYTTNWVLAVCTWSKSNNRTRGYINAGQFRTDVTELGTWSGALNVSYTVIGAADKVGGYVFTGNIAHAGILNREATPAEIKSLNRGVNDYNFTVIGDSIESAGYGWIQQVYGSDYMGGRNNLFNRSAPGNTIMSNMDAQVVSAAGDNARVIILALGTNDTDGGNMTALQAEVEENIVELKASNPNATLYYMNVLPRWTDIGGVTEADKSHIRTAIAAACTAQGITCWDTYADPWIIVTDTSDGIHPTTAGHTKIAAEVLARLP